MKIYVIRHGTTPLNKENKVNGQVDEPLSPEGIEEVKNATSFIPQNIMHIYGSSSCPLRITWRWPSPRYWISQKNKAKLRD